LHRRQFFSGLAAAGLVVVAALPAAAAEAAKPSDVVKRLYVFSAGKSGNWDVPSAYFDAAMRKAAFTKAFVAAITEEDDLLNGDLGAIDFDPISNSQDPIVVNLVVRDVETGPAKATVEAHFRLGREATAPDSTVVYHLVQEGGQWRVDDIVPKTGDGADFSVRQALADSIRALKAEDASKKP
jgi:hypothetical protein